MECDAGNHIADFRCFPPVRFGVFTAMTMKNGVFWDVTPCCSCKNLLTRATWRNIPEDTILHFASDEIVNIDSLQTVLIAQN
jgi:hypothetical protein